MTDTMPAWRRRLLDAIDKANDEGLSARELSRRAGVGPNFIYDLRSSNKSPSTDNVIALAKVVGISLTYLFTGAEQTPQLEAFLEIYTALPEEQRKSLVAFLQQIKGTAPQ